jgi:DNA polymerase-3 subunit beta
MKFNLSSTELLRQLQLVSGAISSNPVLPILEDFLFTIQEKKLTILATDLETTISTSLDVLADEDFAVAIPAKILLETLKALPQQPITFNIDPANYTIEITSSYGKYKLAGEAPDEYPTPASPEDVEAVKVNSKFLLESINKTAFATSTDELRPAMTGVYFQIDNTKLTSVATDAHKLVRYITTNVTGDVVASFIIPKKALNLLKNALPDSDGVSLQFNKVNAFFTFGNVRLICRLIDARYPDYNAVIPVGNANMLVANRADLQNSVKRISIFSNKTTNQVVFDVADGSLTISAQDLDFQNEATEQLPCSYGGKPMRIAFNARFLVEMLGVLQSDEVQIALSTPSKAGILTPIEENNDSDILMLAMPVMVN